VTERRSTVSPRPGAIALVFVANGLGGPSFLARVPERQAALGLSDAGLGLTLAGFALGALVVSPVAGRLVERLGSRAVVVGSGVSLGACLWVAGAAPNALILAMALAVVGAADAAMDIGMNANGAAFERGSGRSVLHRLHGAWSLGALAAAASAGLAAAAGLSLTLHLAVVGVALALVTFTCRNGLVPGLSPVLPVAADASSRPGGVRRQAVKAVAILALATVCGALIEGLPADWAAVQLTREGASNGVAALGLAGFMAGMLAGRLFGDGLTDRHGGGRVLRGGMLLAAAGMAGGVAAGHPVGLVVGLVLAGAGASVLFPMAFGSASRTPGVSPGAGAATVSLAARIGFLAEPLLVGAVAERVGLRWAFVMVAAVAVLVALGSGLITRD
jgi:MFS family permease